MTVRYLTDRVVTQTKAPATGQITITDGETPGFGLRIGSKGARAYFLMYRFGGVQRKVTLGRVGKVGLAEARARATEIVDLVRSGVDPDAAVIDIDNEKPITVIEAFDRYQADPAVRKDWTHPDEYAKVNRRKMEMHAASLLARPIDTVTRADIVIVIRGVHDAGKRTQANRVLSLLRTFFAWAVIEELIADSPSTTVRPPAKERSRERFLDKDEVRLFWQHSHRAGVFRDVLRLLLLTGQRESEVGEMRWREVDLAKRTWTIPGERTKNGRRHEVALSALAVTILEARHRKSEFVFPSIGGTGAMSGYTRAQQRVVKAMAVPRWTIHDLRRTFATHLGDLKIPPHVIEAVLNHRSGTIRGVAATYNRHDYLDEKRQALEAWSEKLMEIVSHG
jgi:integrase